MRAARLEPPPRNEEGIASAREEERRYLARELHDGPAQSLAAALFGLDLAVAAVDRTPGTAREELQAARGLLRDALDDVRALIAGLRPRLLDERGLVAALQAQAAITPLWGPRVSVRALGSRASARLPVEVELGLFRIAQEAISNARRHGEATRVDVAVTIEPGSARLDIVDDGHGFVPGRAPVVPGRGDGLPGMHERATLLGGALAIESAPGSGTRIVARVPLPGNGAAKERA
jgi:signal transduction histidine kinase